MYEYSTAIIALDLCANQCRLQTYQTTSTSFECNVRNQQKISESPSELDEKIRIQVRPS